jgi:hypothetical protein
VDLSTVLPYVKPALDPSAPDGNLVELHDDGAPATRPVVGSLLTTYVVFEGDSFRYITDPLPGEGDHGSVAATRR